MGSELNRVKRKFHPGFFFLFLKQSCFTLWYFFFKIRWVGPAWELGPGSLGDEAPRSELGLRGGEPQGLGLRGWPILKKKIVRDFSATPSLDPLVYILLCVYLLTYSYIT